MRRGYAETPFGQIHYRMAGPSDGWPLVLLHQSPSSSAMWEPVLAPFAQRGYRAIAPDLLGHGASPTPDRQPDLFTYVAGVWALLDVLHVTTADVVGHHSGANVGILMAADRPRRVRALALWGPALMTPERQSRLAGEGQPDWERAEEWLSARWSRRRTASGPEWTPTIGRRSMIELLQAGPNSQWLHNAVAEMPIEPYLPQLEQPVLTLCGERDSLYAESERTAALVSRGRFEPLHGASLDVADQQALAFVDAVDRFLRATIDTSTPDG